MIGVSFSGQNKKRCSTVFQSETKSQRLLKDELYRIKDDHGKEYWSGSIPQEALKQLLYFVFSFRSVLFLLYYVLLNSEIIPC